MKNFLDWLISIILIAPLIILFLLFLPIYLVLFLLAMLLGAFFEFLDKLD